MGVTIPHYLQDHIEQMQHCVEEIHFLNQEVSTMAANLHYEQCQLDCGYPKNENHLVKQENFHKRRPVLETVYGTYTIIKTLKEDKETKKNMSNL